MCTEERKQHRHAAVIKAWADGATIQYKSMIDGRWTDTTDNRPAWYEGSEYRVKPEPIKTEAFVRWWWDKNMKRPRAEHAHDHKSMKARQGTIEAWGGFGGWLSDWESRSFEVEVQ